MSGAWEAVISEMAARRAIGINRYGKPVIPSDASENWLRHLFEELLDGCVYAKAEIERRKELAAEMAASERTRIAKIIDDEAANMATEGLPCSCHLRVFALAERIAGRTV